SKKKDRGWTISREGEEVGEDGRTAIEESAIGDGARERIARRPDGYGPMVSGPPAYRDEESEEMELLASFRVRTVFPGDVLKETEVLPEDPQESDFAGRTDLRGKTIFTIDGADAKDYDDAIQIEEKGDGNVEIGVHIADVAHYVQPGTALDTEALARATSCYLPDQVVPMLPEKLSNGLCSLVPDRPRLAYSVFMLFNEKGDRLDARVEKTVIQSCKRNTYRAVQELLDGEDTEDAKAIKHLEPDLRLFEKWARTSQSKRERKGAMRIQSTEKKFVFDKKGEVEKIVDAPRYFSMSLIEETALAANQAVGDLFRKRGLPTIYRVHPEKDPEEIEAVAASLDEHGIRVPKKERLTGRDISQLIRAARRKANAEALIQRIMGLVERAVYEVRDHEDVATHFGLAKEAYLHFTSPIRRYPDLLVHRWAWAIESRALEAERELKTEDL
ncbi:MAG: RNB domain-containing ribonuclease, partial [Planctomycetota bacterium]